MQFDYGVHINEYTGIDILSYPVCKKDKIRSSLFPVTVLAYRQLPKWRYTIDVVKCKL